MSFLYRWFKKRQEDPENQPLVGHHHHHESHFESPEIIRDMVLGLSDGLTVPFALAAGLASLGDVRIVLLGGIAELVSGAISMGLGGYLAARSDADHYDTERRREEMEVEECEEEEVEEIVGKHLYVVMLDIELQLMYARVFAEILEPYGMDRETLAPFIERLKANPEKFVDFMMKFELNLEKPDPHRSWISALTIGLSYFFGGLIPLIPYAFAEDAYQGLMFSCIVTFVCLLAFGYAKAYFVAPERASWNAMQTALVGAAAAGTAYGAVYYFN